MKSFEKTELEAIYKAAQLMVLADGKILPEETATVEEAMKKTGVTSPSQISEIDENARKLSDEECYGTLAFLDPEQKKFVSAMLGAISSSDGDIDDAEMALWRDVCNKCDLPIMNNRQAIVIFKSF